MAIRWVSPLFAAVIGLLVSCGGGRDTAPVQPRVAAQPAAPSPRLAPPSAALADPLRCGKGQPAQRGVLRYVRDGSDCLRSYSGLGTLEITELAAASSDVDGRKRALAARTISADELFSWAETTFPQIFAPRSQTHRFASYLYRYYAATDNHIAVSGDRAYVQGPITGEQLQFVGTLAELTCAVDPSACANTDCAAPTQWVGLANGNTNTCTPDSGQPPRVPHGGTFTYRDSGGTTVGSATYACSSGQLSLQGNAICEGVTLISCSTSALSWTVGGNTCNPDANEPTQIPSGVTYTFTDSQRTTGRASYACNNGALSKTGTDTCNPPPPQACAPGPGITWTQPGSTQTCTPDELPALIDHESNYLFIDTRSDYTGSKAFRCSSGVLTPLIGGTCENKPLVHDSFGEVAGGADGSASGDGTAADGAPIVGGTVRVVDLNGKVANGKAPTDAKGYYRVDLTGMVPPLVISVQRPDGKFRRSVSTLTPKTNGFIFMAVTGLTDKIASDLAKAAGFNGAAQLTPTIVKNLGQQKLNDVVTAIRNDPVVRNQALGAGLNPDTFDMLSTPFRPDSTGYDKVLDNVVIGTDANGGTTLGPVGGIPPPPATTCSILLGAWYYALPPVGPYCEPTPPVSAPVVLNVGQSVTYFDNVSPGVGNITLQCQSNGTFLATVFVCNP